MKTIVLVLCLLIPLSAWAQKEGTAEPQQLKMIKKGNEAANEGKSLASGIQKSQKEQQPGQPAKPAVPVADEKAKGASQAQQTAQ